MTFFGGLKYYDLPLKRGEVSDLQLGESIQVTCLEEAGGDSLHPGRLTWNLQITHLERKMIQTKPP